MKQVRLGNDTVAAIGQGTMGVGGHFSRYEDQDAEAQRLLRLGIDLGLTLIDTAEIYGAGHAEELVGQAVAGIRHKVTIVTKFSAEHSRAQDVIAAAEGSLRRLDTDYIDVYQPHWPNPSVPIEETLSALDRLVTAGKVRSIGLSNFSVTGVRQADELLQVGKVTTVQQEYSLLERTIEAEMLPYCREKNIAVMAYGPFQQGKLLTRSEATEPLFDMAARYGVGVAELALAWLIREPCVVAIPKASSEQKLRANAAALTLNIEQADLELLSEAFRPKIALVPTNQVDAVDADDGRSVFRTIDEARKNTLNLSPSPVELSEEIKALGGKLQRPIKLRRDRATGRYSLVEGRLKYWAWLIAYGETRPIPAVIENEAAPAAVTM